MGDWRRQANCAGAVDVMIPATDHPSQAQIDAAKNICRSCTVRPECLEYAMTLPIRDTVGVWAGTTQDDRRKLKRNRSRKKAS